MGDRSSGGVRIFDTAGMPWTETGMAGVRQKVAYRDDATGRYLALGAVDSLARTGLHQHRDVASSLFLAGALADYWGTTGQGQVGINLAGATHDAIAYGDCLLVTRMEGPVAYPHDHGPLNLVHAGAHFAEIANRSPETPPDIAIAVADLPSIPTGLPSVARRMVFDYAQTPHCRRLVQLQLFPGARLPPHRTSQQVDWYVIGGALDLSGRPAGAASLVTIEPDTMVEAHSPYGCLLLAWAEGPVRWADRAASDLYGF